MWYKNVRMFGLWLWVLENWGGIKFPYSSFPTPLWLTDVFQVDIECPKAWWNLHRNVRHVIGPLTYILIETKSLLRWTTILNHIMKTQITIPVQVNRSGTFLLRHRGTPSVEKCHQLLLQRQILQLLKAFKLSYHRTWTTFSSSWMDASFCVSFHSFFWNLNKPYNFLEEWI